MPRQAVSGLQSDSPPCRAVCLQRSMAPLLFAGDSVWPSLPISPVHFHSRAVAQEIGSLFAGVHLRAICAAVTAIGLCGGGWWPGRRWRRTQGQEGRLRRLYHRHAQDSAVIGDIGDKRTLGRLQIVVPETVTNGECYENFFHLSCHQSLAREAMNHAAVSASSEHELLCCRVQIIESQPIKNPKETGFAWGFSVISGARDGA